jgi:hypothetical protein
MTPVTEEPMLPEEEEDLPPLGHACVVYLGPVAPHWEVRSDYGDSVLIEEFRRRTMARLVLLPPHDPQYRRNRERVIRDAERERITLEWDLGVPEEEPATAPAGDDPGAAQSVGSTESGGSTESVGSTESGGSAQSGGAGTER